MQKRPPKKSDSLEVRLPHSTKDAFMARARNRGRSASSLLREFIDSYLADTDPTKEKRKMLKNFLKPAAVTTLAASAVALFLVAPSAASAAPDLKALFERLDRDRDGLLSSAEFVREDAAGAQAALDRMDLGKMLPALFVYHAEGGLTGVRPAGSRADGPMQIVFAKQDSDGNGVVSFGEFEAAQLGTLRATFEFVDFDDDGAIEENELREVLGHLPAAAARKVRPFAEIDRNGDAAISWDEFLA